MKQGGVNPKMCQEQYTNYTEAKMALERYLRINDRMGRAQYPGKEVENVGESKTE